MGGLGPSSDLTIVEGPPGAFSRLHSSEPFGSLFKIADGHWRCCTYRDVHFSELHWDIHIAPRMALQSEFALTEVQNKACTDSIRGPHDRGVGHRPVGFGKAWVLYGQEISAPSVLVASESLGGEYRLKLLFGEVPFRHEAYSLDLEWPESVHVQPNAPLSGVGARSAEASAPTAG